MKDNLRIGALYIRVSTHDQDELSPDAQKRLGLEFAKNNDIIIPNDYIFVESVSGRKVKNRREFQKMIALAKSPEHPFDVIVVWKFSRFARNQEESIVYKSMLKKDGIDVISISEPLIDGPFGSLIERIIEWMDEYYSIRLSGEVVRGMNEKALKKGYQKKPPLGYQAVGNGMPYVINEEEFKIVNYIFNQFDTHDKDYTAIARSLNSMGYKTRQGLSFEARSIKRILKNPFYYGLVIWNDVKFMGTHEVRLTEEQYEKRMLKIKNRYKPHNTHDISSCKHWLSGLLKCGYCGHSLGYNGTHRHSPGFQCWHYSKGYHPESCSISEKKVTAAVYEYLEKLLDGMDFEFTYRSPETTELETEQNLILEELNKISTREARIALAFENGIDTLEEYAENKKRLKKAREDLEKQLENLKASPVPHAPSKDDALKKVKTVYDIIKNPDVDYTVKGTVMRSLFESIVYNKAENILEFHIYIS